MNPQLPVQWSPVDLVLEAIAAVGLAGQIGLLLPKLPRLPEQVPVHFDFAGRPDRMGPRATLTVLPLVSLVAFVLLTVVARLPHLANYPVAITPDNAARQYRLATILLTLVKTEMVWLVGFLGWRAARVALGEATGLGRYFLPVFLAVLAGTPLLWVILTLRAR